MSQLFKKTPGRSLRSILMIWFIFFSLVPLAFITFYTIFKFEKALDNELAQRLIGNGREIIMIIKDFENSLQSKKDSYISDSAFRYQLISEDKNYLLKKTSQWIKSDFTSSIQIYNIDGILLSSVYKDKKKNIISIDSQNKINIDKVKLSLLKNLPSLHFISADKSNQLTLRILSRIEANEKVYGFIEQGIELDSNFTKKLKERLELDISIVSEDGNVLLTSQNDIRLFKPGTVQRMAKSNTISSLTLRGSPLGFIGQKTSWGGQEIYILLSTDKSNSKKVLNNVNYTFLSMLAVISVLLILSIFIASNIFLKPIYELLDGIQSMHDIDSAIELPIKNDTEIGMLTSAFNEMSRKIAITQKDLKKKILELETANAEIKETQSQLVQSAKMASLGQLVAGVAHELNNPIGFIYSNMNHLREYSEKIIALLKTAEQNPSLLQKQKEEFEIEYIEKDLPKLIKSCEEGARRTKDIVIGLRNFSRLQEAQLKDADLEVAIDTSLDLLAGEIKNRIEIIKDYGKIPKVTCLASQINQVIMNILSNALQAIEGQGKVWIVTKVIKENDPLQNKISISFQDTGKGIEKAALEKIFDPFYTTKGVGQGTGLGLSISYGIIKNHGGEIQVRSEVGVGTEFTIVLPIKNKIIG